MLSSLPSPLEDPLFALLSQFRQDARVDKMDLLIGVYRDESGATPLLDAVRDAQIGLAQEAASKSYRSLEGNGEFNAAMAQLLLGADPALLGRQYTMQTVGGTGALRLLADFIAVTTPHATVWTSDPGYVNHGPILRSAGLRQRTYRWAEDCGTLDLERVLRDLVQARPGDVVLLHGCCHNPTGIDMTSEGWAAIGDLCAAAGLIPWVDMAYQGFGAGLEEDAAGLRMLTHRTGTVLLAASCSKNIGLYCERTGTASVIGVTPARVRPVAGTLQHIARAAYSMPPDHGAAIALRVLQNPAGWHRELAAMRQRVKGLRTALYDALVRQDAAPALLAIRRHNGMFSQLALPREAMRRLREDFAVYGTDEGRINIAGLRRTQIEPLAKALTSVSCRTAA